MPFLSSHKDLFRTATTMEKLIFFQTLLEGQMLNSGEALAFLKTIHMELTDQQGRYHSGYREFALGMNSLRHLMPEVHEWVIEAWRTRSEGWKV
jgi:hypothetical protein